MAEGNRPRVSRRREVSHASARSLLVTVLGEFALPRGEPVWTSTFVRVLARFGIEEKAARQALTRAANEGWISSERAGRRVRWQLTGPGRRLLTEGAERIYGFGRSSPDWDRRWLILLVSIPDSQRELRHRVKSQLSWAGFGSPNPGVWVSPRTQPPPEAGEIIAELKDGGQAMSFVAAHGDVSDEVDMVSRAWDLTGLEARYEEFIDQFTGLKPATSAAAFDAHVKLVHEWRRFPFLDPGLPRDLLPARWSGEQAAKLFHTQYDEWREPALRHWETLADAEEAA
ncbi:PaaX family transcriptional regulator C-terminal domain-containing protein [Amycolatopsis sp.]|uniref:PaaX family transcriptional regulator n=1 Tax=Amycolatopsis sp. TaxID=37632 RepID=UPI002C934226|nr:PaaX family transcriptional regulator C-terminal domain-containing protein [Amycolatopsis sp.]HVV11249.1 PaaX family transcriptional regulator C-terminal domain-containing protein [Amycolatopsis sp.]